jgi:hypothetical protein
MRSGLFVSLLGWLLASSAMAQPRSGLVTVAVDMTQLDAASFARVDGVGLEKRILLRLVQDGFAVVRPEQGPDVLVSVQAKGPDLMLEARTQQGVKVARVAAVDLPFGELHLELTQRLVALLHAVLAPVPTAAPIPTVTPTPTDEWALNLGAQVLIRSGGVDPLIELNAGAAAVGPLWLELAGAWSTSRGTDLRVHEWQLAAGASCRFKLGDAMYGSMGLQVGALAHDYHFSAPAAARTRGTRVDTLFLLPLRLTTTFGSRWQIGLQVTPGAANHSRGHQTSEGFVWRRGALRLQTGLIAGAVW